MFCFCNNEDTNGLDGMESILARYINREEIHICDELAKI
jgi:hypothetical protein